MWDDERYRLKQDKEDVPKRTKEGKPDQDDRELQGTVDATPKAHSSHTPDVLALTPDATLLSGNTGPERPVALTTAQSEDSTSSISPQALLASIQSAPLTSNNRANMPQTAVELDRMDSNPSLFPAPKPIARADALGLSMSESSYASNYNTSKAPFVCDPVGSSVDPKYAQMKKEEKEKSRRPNRDSHSELPSAFSTDGETHSKTGAEPPLQGSTSYHAMRYIEDYRIPASRIEKRNRGNTNYKKRKTY